MTAVSPLVPLLPRPEVPQSFRTAHERLAFELALQHQPAGEVFAAHGLTVEQATELLANPAFAAMLERITKEVRENGVTFRLKARAIAEELLPEAYSMAKDENISASVRAELIQWSARIAGLEPPKDKVEGPGGGLTLNITFAGQEAQRVVAQEPLTLEAQ